MLAWADLSVGKQALGEIPFWGPRTDQIEDEILGQKVPGRKWQLYG